MSWYRNHHPGTAAMGETITDNENTDNKLSRIQNTCLCLLFGIILGLARLGKEI